MSKMSRVTSYNQLRLAKQDLLPETNSLDFQILIRAFLPFATIMSLAIFCFTTVLILPLLLLDHVSKL